MHNLRIMLAQRQWQIEETIASLETRVGREYVLILEKSMALGDE